MVYVALLRGINVGGKNILSMADLRKLFEKLDFKNVKTYINSGNVIFESDQSAIEVTKIISEKLPMKILVISREELGDIIKTAPKGFGSHPGKYHSDVAFLIGQWASEVMDQVEVNPEVDKAWPGVNVIYYQRLSAKRTKSRLSKTISKPVYKFMTIRTWGTVNKLAQIMDQM